MVLFTLKEEEKRQIGGTTVDELLFWWGRHDGRKSRGEQLCFTGSCMHESQPRQARSESRPRQDGEVGVAAASLCHGTCTEKAIGDGNDG